MKFLLLFFIFMVLLWQWRHARQPKVRAARKNTRPTPVQEMLQCAHCGVHMPAADAIKGRKGLYCSAAHCQAQEP